MKEQGALWNVLEPCGVPKKPCPQKDGIMMQHGGDGECLPGKLVGG